MIVSGQNQSAGERIAQDPRRVDRTAGSPPAMAHAVFEYRRTPFGGTRLTAPAGQHDGCVIALALCLWGMEQPRGGFIYGPSLVTRDDDET